MDSQPTRERKSRNGRRPGMSHGGLSAFHQLLDQHQGENDPKQLVNSPNIRNVILN